MSDLEALFNDIWKKEFPNLPLDYQYVFHKTKKWRIDFCHFSSKVAIELQGYGKGHTNYLRMKNDIEKHNALIEDGWTVLLFMKSHLEKEPQKTIYLIQRMIRRNINAS